MTMVSASPLIREIANYIAECAVELGVGRNVTWKEFRAWLVDEREADTDIVSRFDKALKYAGGFNAVRDAFLPAIPTAQDIEKSGIGATARLHRKSIKLQAEEDLFLKEFESALNRTLPKMKFDVGGYSLKPKRKEKTRRIVTLFLSDLHIGARLDAREVMWGYGPVETARRLAKVTSETIEYKRDYREETECHLILGGDIMQGQLHDPRDGAAMAEQFEEALFLLTQVMVVLAANFPKLKIFCTTGNHDRRTARHKERATHEKWDSYATMLYLAIQNRAATIPNVEMHIPRTSWVEIPVFDYRVYCTHGDTNLNVGNPGNNVNIKSLEVQMNRINVGEVDQGRKPFRLFMAGHVHFGGLYFIPGNYHLITNPALIHKDSYGLGLGHGQACGQTLFESTPEHLVGDYRMLKVGREVDKDSSFDRIIKPYEIK